MMADVMPGSRLPEKNPFWEDIQRLIQRGFIEYDESLKTLNAHSGHRQDLRDLTVEYGEVVPDPGLLAWSGAVLGTGVVEVDARDGQWSYLFEQMGKRVTAYDYKPPRLSRWPLRVKGLDRKRRVLTEHGADSLFAVRPKLENVAVALQVYLGTTCLIITDVRPESNARLAKAFAGAGWRMRETYQGVCLEDKIYTAYWYSRYASGWASVPTQRMPIVPLRGEGK